MPYFQETLLADGKVLLAKVFHTVIKFKSLSEFLQPSADFIKCEGCKIFIWLISALNQGPHAFAEASFESIVMKSFWHSLGHFKNGKVF